MTPTTTPTRMTVWLEQAWMVRYLDRQLTGEEAAWFEAYALDKPELLAMIEGDTRLRDALAADASMWHMERSVERGGRQGGATRGAPHGVSEPSPAAEAHTGSEPGAAKQRRAPAWLAMAATLVVGLGLGWIGTRSLAPDNAAPELVANPTRIVYDTMRGVAARPRVEHADSKSPYVLIEVAVPPGAENITLKIDNAPAQTLPASPEGFVSFLLLRKTFSAARKADLAYVLGGQTTVNSIEFRLDPEDQR